MCPVDKDPPFLEMIVRRGSWNRVGAGSAEHDRFSGAHLGEMKPATVTEQGSERHLGRRNVSHQATGRQTRYVHSENMAHYREIGVEKEEAVPIVRGESEGARAR